MIADLPPGAVAVIFHSVRRADDGDAAGAGAHEDAGAGAGAGAAGADALEDATYADVAERMAALAAQQPGYLGARSVRDPHTREGVTVSYWRDDASARAWKSVAEHLVAQRRGREEFYAEYDVIIAEVIRAYRHP